MFLDFVESFGPRSVCCSLECWINSLPTAVVPDSSRVFPQSLCFLRCPLSREKRRKGKVTLAFGSPFPRTRRWKGRGEGKEFAELFFLWRRREPPTLFIRPSCICVCVLFSNGSAPYPTQLCLGPTERTQGYYFRTMLAYRPRMHGIRVFLPGFVYV